MGDAVTKVSVNLPTSAVNALKELAAKRGTTMTEVLKSAIGTEKFMADTVASGSKVLVEHGRGNVRELVFPHDRKVK